MTSVAAPASAETDEGSSGSPLRWVDAVVVIVVGLFAVGVLLPSSLRFLVLLDQPSADSIKPDSQLWIRMLSGFA